MNFKTIIPYLKESCLIDDPTMVEDSMFLALTDSELESMLQVANSKVTTSLPHLKEEEERLYALVLYCKQEVYSRLSLKYAIQFDLESEVGKLAKSQRFTHFAKLLELAKEEWNEYCKEQLAQRDVSNTDNYSDLAQGQIFINRHYFSARNTMYHNKPVAVATIENVQDSFLDVSWKVKRINHFKEYKLLISKTPIYDKFENTLKGDKVITIQDFHRTAYRIKDLEPNTTYYIALVIEEANGLKGIHELVVTTEVI